MLDYLDKLRAKPVHVRQRIALFVTATLSLFVVTVWVGTLNTERPVSTTFVASKANTPSPWSVVSDMLKHTKGEMTAAVSEATAQFTEVTAGSVEYDPSKESPVATDETIDETPLWSADGETEEGENVSAFPDAFDTGIAGEAVRTRPGTWDDAATGTISGNDMVE